MGSRSMQLASLGRLVKYFLVAALIVEACAIATPQTMPGRVERGQTLPIEFEPNRGQLPGNALYFARTQTLFLTLGNDGMNVVLMRPQAGNLAVSFRFENTNPEANLVGSDPTGGESNYLIGGDESNWHTHVPHFARATYTRLYAGIDLVFYGSGPHLEHDFIVAPGADPQSIRMRVLPAGGKVAVTEEGHLSVIGTENDEIVIFKPQIYQMNGSQRQAIKGGFSLQGSDEVTFAIGEYDRSRALIIDPALSASTYLADLSLNVAAVATDTLGNTYVSGLTFSPAYPVTPGSLQSSCASCGASLPDVFVTKLNPQGTAQVYSTYLGGTDYDQPFGMAVDPAGNTIVVGYTQSTDFPTKNAIAHGFASVGTSFGFISSLTANGSALNYSSLLGGSTQQSASSSTSAAALALDQHGNAYIAGQTDADAFPVTTLHCCSVGYPNSIVFVTKFLTNGKLGYSALIGNPEPQNGGGGPIGVSALQVDGLGSAYVSGQAGTLWPITAGAYQKQIGGTAPYAAPFVTKLNPNGTALVYSTYLGNGNVNGIALDAAANVWITGTPNGPNFPVTTNAYQPTSPSSNCCVPFFSKLNTTGSKLLYSSYFYGNGSVFGFSQPSAIALDAAGNVWLAGRTVDPQWPLLHPIEGLPGSLFTTSTGFVSRFNSTGTTLTFSTFFGGLSGGAQVLGLALDGKGLAHIAGFAADDLYTTPSAFLPTVTPPPPDNFFTYGFAAVIDPNAISGSVCVAYPNNQGLFFGYVRVGKRASQTVTINNCGTAGLTVTGLQSSLAQFTIPNNLNGCQQPIAVNSSCTITVVFAPTQVTSYSGTLTVLSNASVHAAVLEVSGSGAVPQIQTDTQSLIFDPQFLNQTSPPQFLFVSNAGLVPLVINLPRTIIQGDFAYTQSGCNTPIQPGANCFFELTFTPRAAGKRSGQLSIVSNDPATPVLVIALSGVGYSAYPVPVLSDVDTPSIAKNPTAVTINVDGANFFPASVARINGVDQTTTYANSTRLSVSISPSNLQNMQELKLTVANPAPGGGISGSLTLTVYFAIPLEASALAYDPVSKLLYAAVPATATKNANSVVPINPVTGALGHPIPVGHDPQKLALSTDGSYLYVALNGDHTIQRITLKTHVIERTFPIPVDASFGQTSVAFLGVVPGAPQLLVTALFRQASPAEDGVALYDDKGLVNWLPNDFQHAYTTVDSFTFVGTPPMVYAVPFLFSNPFFQSYSVSPSGIQAITSGSSQQYESALIASDGTLIYVADGTVWDPTTKKQVGAINPPLFFAAGIVPDTAHKRVFFLDQFATKGVSVESYDQNSLALKGSVTFPSLFAPDVFALNRWSTNGFAFQVGNFVSTQSSNQLILFKSSI